MKTKRQTTRPVTGILLTAGSIALLASPVCGTLGRGLSQLLYTVIGTPGVALLAITLCLCGTVCLVPAGTMGRLLAAYRKRRQQSRYTAIQVIPPRTLSRGEELRQAMEAEGYDPADVQRVLPQMVKLSKGIEDGIRNSARAAGRAS